MSTKVESGGTTLTCTFEDIMTAPLVFFDPELESELLGFCQRRDITMLPVAADPVQVAILSEEGSFDLESMPEKQKIQRSAPVFSATTVERFQSNKVLFVYDHHRLVGVLHFSDYNRPGLRAHLYKRISEFEIHLREFLVRKGFGNQDMVEFFESKKDNESYQRKLQRFSQAPPPGQFQAFDLSDLIGLIRRKAKSAEISRFELPLDDLRLLRNSIMHSTDHVRRLDYESEDLVYDFESFARFFRRVQALEYAERLLSTRLILQRERAGFEA